MYETDEQSAQNRDAGVPNVGVGESCLIRGAIVDKNARIGDNSIIANTENKDNCDEENYCIREQIVIIPKDAVIMPGTVI